MATYDGDQGHLNYFVTGRYEIGYVEGILFLSQSKFWYAWSGDLNVYGLCLQYYAQCSRASLKRFVIASTAKQNLKFLNMCAEKNLDIWM